jgi:UDP-N-acetylglucosamine transferase subunit ALG13
MSTFVSLGTVRRPFTRLIEAVEAIAGDLPQPVIVQSGHTPVAGTRCEVRAFLPMPAFEACVDAAELVILQAGGGGVLAALRYGKVPVLVPRRAGRGEHIDDHQLAWARAMAASGRVVVVEDGAALLAGARLALARQREGALRGSTSPMVALVGAALGRAAAR